MKSLRGVAHKGEPVNPGELPEESDEAGGEPKAAPTPGVPISEEEYRRMKEVAEHRRPPRVKEAQEDHPQEDRAEKEEKRGTGRR